MAQFSAVEAATEGFRLMRRRPGMTAAWILAWMVLAFGPVIALCAVFMPHLHDWLSELKNLSANGAGDHFDTFRTVFFSMMAPWLLWYLAAETIITAAIYRAVLEPRNSTFAYLRLGMDEVRLFLLRILLFFLLIFFWCLLIGGCIAVFAAAQSASGGAAPWIDAAAVLLATMIGVYVPVRLSLAGPMTFARKRIEVFGSWRRTRGRFWSLVLMILVIVVFFLVVSIIAQGLEKVAISLLGDWRSIDDLDKLGNDPKVVISTIMRAVGPGLIAVFIIQGIADLMLRVVYTVPFATAYSDLAPRPTAEPAVGGAIPAHA